MIQNHFDTSPTVGSHDNLVSMESLQTRITQLENQLHEAQAQERRAAIEEKKKSKFGWKKMRKFFTSIIRPILTFIPNLINAIANLKKSAALTI